MVTGVDCLGISTLLTGVTSFTAGSLLLTSCSNLSGAAGSVKVTPVLALIGSCELRSCDTACLSL